MSDTLLIQPLTQGFVASIRPPGSKSLTNRALLLAALAQGRSTLRHALDADDPQRMRDGLNALGVAITAGDDEEISLVDGAAGGLGCGDVSLHLGNAGTAYRFLTAACSFREGSAVLDGVPRMRQRPIGQLVDLLERIGARIEHLGEPGFPPLRVHGGGLDGGELTVTPTLSSQYISALLHVGPLCRKGLVLSFEGPITSEPYVHMTLSVMQRFGVTAEAGPGLRRIEIAPGRYRGTEYDIEPDASAASYFLAAAAIVPGSRCTVLGLGFRSVQGDAGFAEVLQQMGASVVIEPNATTVLAPPEGQKLRGIDVNLNHMPDMAQTLAVAALFADGPTVIRDVGNLRVKETDRLAALQAELTKLGATVAVDGDDIHITPPADPLASGREVVIDTYEDHRMAMSFALAGLRRPGVRIANPGCVDKTYPQFFADLAAVTGAAV